MNALAYTSIINNLTSSEEHQDIYNDLQIADINNKSIQNILDNTAMKRAVCNPQPGFQPGDDYQINIEVPISDKIREPLPDQEKFGYLPVQLTIPYDNKTILNLKSQGYTSNSKQCDDFYYIYCKNMYKNYLNYVKATGGTPTLQEWSDFKKECSCYGVIPDWMNNVPEAKNLPKKCWMVGCEPNQQVYLDPTSQGDVECNVQICNQINTYQELQAKTINIDDRVNMKCGEDVNGNGKQPDKKKPDDKQPDGKQPDDKQPDGKKPKPYNLPLIGGGIIGIVLSLCLFLILIGVGIFFLYKNQ